MPRNHSPGRSISPEALRKLESEASFQQWFIEFGKAHGWTVIHFHTSLRLVKRQGEHKLIGEGQAAGLPDNLCIRNGVKFWAELKSATGRVSGAQQRMLAQLDACGDRVFVWRPADRPLIEGLMR